MLASPPLPPLKVSINNETSSIPSWQPIHAPNIAKNLPELKIDPQSCKPASELASEVHPPNELYGYDLVQGISFVGGDFSYEFWLYCDPSLKPDDNEHFSSVDGLGVYAAWRYDGSELKGTSQDYFGFEPLDKGKSFTKWIGPLYKASESGTFPMPAKEIIQENLQAGTPLQFSILVDSSLGENSATFSFHLEPTENGLKVVDLRVDKNEVVEQKPTPEPTQTATSENLPPIGTGKGNGEWIAFIGGTIMPDPVEPTAVIANQDVYKVHPDRSGLTNLTGFPAHYYDLQWSPDGQHLLFLMENPLLNKINIMRHYAGVATGFGEITRPISDPDHYGYSWSPNSDKIVFADSSSGNYDIYTEYADGRNDPKLTQLTDDPAQDVGFAWSPDGSQIAFQRLTGERLSIYVMNEDGADQREVAQGTGKVQLEWSQDGTSIYASSTENSWLECEGCVTKPAIYRIKLDEPSVHQIYYEEDANKVAGWYLYDTPQNTLYFMRVKPQAFVEFWGTWFRADGNSVTEIGEMDPAQTCKATTGNILSEDISPNPRFSVISNFCAGGFDLYLADREATPEKRFIHLLQLPLDTWGQGGDFATLPMTWSADGHWLIYDDGNGRTYLLDIERAMQDSETALIPLIEPTLFTSVDAQVHQSSETFNVFDLVWQPMP